MSPGYSRAIGLCRAPSGSERACLTTWSLKAASKTRRGGVLPLPRSVVSEPSLEWVRTGFFGIVRFVRSDRETLPVVATGSGGT